MTLRLVHLDPDVRSTVDASEHEENLVEEDSSNDSSIRFTFSGDIRLHIELLEDEFRMSRHGRNNESNKGIDQ